MKNYYNNNVFEFGMNIAQIKKRKLKYITLQTSKRRGKKETSMKAFN